VAANVALQWLQAMLCDALEALTPSDVMAEPQAGSGPSELVELLIWKAAPPHVQERRREWTVARGGGGGGVEWTVDPWSPS